MSKSKDYPLVSVILSVYNDESNVLDAVNSILKQTYKNLELLIMNDGSIDDTSKVLNQINDERVKIFNNKKNIGLTKSLNKLIYLSNGNFIARQDSDDISEENRILKQYEFLLKKDLDACTARAKIKNTSTSIPGISFYLPTKLTIRYKNPFIHGTLFIRKSTLLMVGNYDETYYYSQDYTLIFYNN